MIAFREVLMRHLKLIYIVVACFWVFILLGFSKQLDTWGMDGENLQVILPSEEEVSKLVSTSGEQYKSRLGIFSFQIFFCVDL